MVNTDESNSVDKLNKKINNNCEKFGKNKKLNNKKIMEWTRGEILKLLKEYKNRRVLWDWNCHGYRDRTKRKYAIKELADLFHCNTLEIEKKITNLKCQYSREVHKIQNSCKNQLNTDDNIYQSKWFAYKSMEFLQFGTRKCKKKPEEEQQEEEYLVSDIDPESIKYIDFNDDTNVSESGSYDKSSNEDFINENLILQASHFHNISMNNNDYSKINNDEKLNNENDIDCNKIKEEFIKFGESIACQLSKIPDSYSRSVAKLKINQIIFEAEIGIYAQENH